MLMTMGYSTYYLSVKNHPPYCYHYVTLILRIVSDSYITLTKKIEMLFTPHETSTY